jgi:hypothetical protein
MLAALCLVVSTSWLQSATASSAPPNESLIVNGDFESGAEGWKSKDNGMSQLSPEAAHSGSVGLRVTDDDAEKGSNFASTPVPATPRKSYELTFWGRLMSGKDAAVHIQFFDKDKNQITKLDLGNDIKIRVKGEKWQEYTLKGTAPADAATVRVWVHTSMLGKAIVDVDDVVLVEGK